MKKGLKAVDPKLLRMASMNEMLAHKPWAVDADIIGVNPHIAVIDPTYLFFLTKKDNN